MNTPQPTIVILGAGRIGRGFVADLFNAAGYHLVLVDRSAELVAALRAAGRYTVVSAENAERRQDHVITGYEAYTTGQHAEVTRAVATADLLAVAVFPGDFGAVALSVLPGLAQRREERPDATLDILLCANLTHAASHFRAALDAAASEEMRSYLDGRVGVVDTLVMRMVADPPAAEREGEPLLVWTNGLAQFPVDGRASRGPLPDVPGLRPVANMRAEETRKLYTYNMCHAALAYLGSLRGYDLTVDCLADPCVRGEVEAALDEISRALQAEYGFSADEMARWNAGVIAQTDNPTLNDRVVRHGADPRRKLKRSDRLVGPALLARAHGIPPVHLARAIAAAFRFGSPDDPGAVYVRERVAAVGLAVAVAEVCELRPEEDDLKMMICQAQDSYIAYMVSCEYHSAATSIACSTGGSHVRSDPLDRSA
jgi:mannitol-1-phosphate 5-dehydrogenase